MYEPVTSLDRLKWAAHLHLHKRRDQWHAYDITRYGTSFKVSESSQITSAFLSKVRYFQEEEIRV
jgi:hypothetical protein